MSPSIFPPCTRVAMPSKARVLFELTWLHWFKVRCDLIVDSNSCPAWGVLSAAYHVALPMSDVVTNTVFSVLLGILVHSAGCIMNDSDILDRDFSPKVRTFQVVMTVTGLLMLFYMNRTFEGPNNRIRSCH